MLRTHSQTRTPASKLHHSSSAVLLVWLVLFGAGLTLLPFIVSFVHFLVESPVLTVTQPETAVAVAALYDREPVVRDRAISQLAHSSSAEATNQLLTFFQHDEYIVDNGLATAHALAVSGTPQALRALIHSLGSEATPSRRAAAMSALEESKASTNGLLIGALNDPDPMVREYAAQLLGYRQSGEAGTALLSATQDVEPAVRESAAWALSEVANVQALPRLEQMRLLDSDARVRETASLMRDRIYSRVMSKLGQEVHALAVAPSGQAYAAASDGLFVWRDGAWQPVNLLPDVVTALTAGGDHDQLLYIGTDGHGLFRSEDAGQHVQAVAGLPQDATVTALALDPLDARQAYVALARATGLDARWTPVGVYVTRDGGAIWQAVDAAPGEQVTTQLLLDSTSPRFLFGATEDHAWRANIRE